MGGDEAVDRHLKAGKLTARQRITKTLDQASFKEIGALTGAAEYDEQGNLIEFTPANVVIGSGRVDDRRVVVSAEDFTVRGGSSEASISDKWIWAETLALEIRMPLIRLVDTAGGSVKLLDKMGATKLPGYKDWKLVDILGIVPVASAALGSVAGLGAARVVASHFSVMVKETSQAFAAGPPVVMRATGEDLSKEELGATKFMLVAAVWSIMRPIAKKTLFVRSDNFFPIYLPAYIKSRLTGNVMMIRADARRPFFQSCHAAEKKLTTRAG